jgi:hypothetical protein
MSEWLYNHTVQYILDVLPDGTGFPAEVHASAVTFGSYIDMWQPLIPFDTLYQILGFVFAVEIAILGFRAMRWVISVVRGSGA